MSPWLVVGLGNPGPTYASHRHNIGYHVVDELASRTGSRFAVPRGIRAEVAEGRLGPPGQDVPRLALVKSRTYMNETGGAVSQLLAYFKIEQAQLVVIGHNGLKSIRKSLGGGDYFRVRVGVGRPPGRQDPADFLLSNFPASAREEVALEVQRAADAVESLVQIGLERTQSAFNS
jgi:PTH1 family peptidyl-tRNA hydrolase